MYIYILHMYVCVYMTMYVFTNICTYILKFRSLREELDQEFSENKMKSSWQRWGRIENEIRKKKMVCDTI